LPTGSSGSLPAADDGFLPALLLLAVTNHILRNIAAIPLLGWCRWRSYLLTSHLFFYSPRWYVPVVLDPGSRRPRWNHAFTRHGGIVLLLQKFLASCIFCRRFSVCCMFCLANWRHSARARYLSAYYLITRPAARVAVCPRVDRADRAARFPGGHRPSLILPSLPSSDHLRGAASDVLSVPIHPAGPAPGGGSGRLSARYRAPGAKENTKTSPAARFSSQRNF